MTWCMTAPSVSALNGSLPVAANSMIPPHANTSAGAPARSPVNTSGAMYVGVPEISPVAVSDISSVRARPKSITRGPSGPSRTLSGFMSLWITPASWIAVSAVATPVASRCSSPGVKLLPSRTAEPRLGPSTYSLTRYGRGPVRSASITAAVQKEETRWAAVASRLSRPTSTPCSILIATRRPVRS
jgi:hypothetical protein